MTTPPPVSDEEVAAIWPTYQWTENGQVRMAKDMELLKRRISQDRERLKSLEAAITRARNQNKPDRHNCVGDFP